MASKYKKLNGTVPRQPTERGLALQAKLDEWKNDPLATLTALYNHGAARAKEIAASAAAVAVNLEALRILIEEKLDELEGEAVTINGYTWSPKYEPYPVCQDPAEIVKYFTENGMADQLTLSNTELADRLKKLVKEEALAGELDVRTREIEEEDGSKRTITEVFSKVPGVKVFLKSSLSRSKASHKE